MQQSLSSKRLLQQKIGFAVLGTAAGIVLVSVAILLFFIVRRGLPIMSWEFLSQPPKRGMTEGGFYPALVGTFLLGVGAMLFSLPIGVMTAIYLSEFASAGRFTKAIRTGVNTLAGLPSIVFGLFGFAFFCKVLRFGVSVLSGALTLGVMALPIVIVTTEEALRAVPTSFREASLSLGATRWRTTVKVVLPNAVSGIVTGAILSMGRAVGETAPIIFTAATFYTRRLPKTPLDEVMALPFHIYGLVTEGVFPEKQLPIAYGSALTLVMLVLILSGAGIYLRYRTRRKRIW
ncbi:MAG TPA: phosphate ABC transporter permease PstA [candidate division Zixibacteria bacterium]|nr:phosphate ABC transporter permease PstA [candidate division Zixibacteria bacterium]